jgi:hypothetical protein
MGYYDTAQVCLNGHVINGRSTNSPDHNEKFCGKCGEQTITKCENCNTSIRGNYIHNGMALSPTPKHAEKFCHHCGQSYPWTKRGLEAAKELADEFETLNSDERDELKKSLDELVKDSPKTEVASFRFKKLMQKAGSGSIEIMKAVISDLLSEAAKKSVFGN